MWAEFLIGISIILTLLSVSLTAFTGYDHEQSEFNCVTRTFYFNLKRYQLQSMYGFVWGTVGDRLFYIDNHKYWTKFYSNHFGKEEYTLPDTMEIQVLPHSFYLLLGGLEGQKQVGRIWINDYKLKRGRVYVFSQQTVRIRWLEERL